jgi:hypothetical protein
MYPFCSPFVFMSRHNDACGELRKVNRAFDFIQGLEKNILGFNIAPETTTTHHKNAGWRKKNVWLKPSQT